MLSKKPCLGDGYSGYSSDRGSIGAALFGVLSAFLANAKGSMPGISIVDFSKILKAISSPFFSLGGALSSAIDANNKGVGSFPAALAARFPLIRTLGEPVFISPSGELSPKRLSIPSATQSAAASITLPRANPVANPAPIKTAAAAPPVTPVNTTAAAPTAA
ncbi:Uncharacterised protein [Acinetobacter baumannii]|nr:Uncharacterised protein [Acinetobacter baumannii]